MTAGLPAAFFVSSDLHAKTIELPDGAVHLLLFRGLNAAEYMAVQRLARSENEEERDRHQALMISLSLCDEDGNRISTPEEIGKVHPIVHAQMYVAAFEATGQGAKRVDPGNASPPGAPSGSGTS